MLFLASYEQDIDPLPDHWMDDTGASREAIEYLHPYANLAQRVQDVEERHGIEREPIHDLSSRQMLAGKPAKDSGPGADGQGKRSRREQFIAILRRLTRKPTYNE
jgi:hypothetical protein